MIFVGTSGYSYKDWVGEVYPAGTKSGEMLGHYAKRFSTVEINSTYYAIPQVKVFQEMLRKVPGEFRFVVKANQEMTHKLDRTGEVFNKFAEALKPLSESKQLACVLLQFPYSFYCTRDNYAYLDLCRERLENHEIVVEFRNSRWLSRETLLFLKKRGISYCCVDEPDLKGLVKSYAVVTGKIGYVRFHGRNSEKWWNHKESYERYNYLYTEQELAEWVPKILKMDEQVDYTYVFMNNHYLGQAVINATQLSQMLFKIRG